MGYWAGNYNIHTDGQYTTVVKSLASGARPSRKNLGSFPV